MRSQKRPSRSGLSVRLLIVSGFVTSPDDQSRICLLDASPIRIASKSLMSIKWFFLPQRFERVRHPVREGLGRRPRVCARSLSFLYVSWFCERTCLFLSFFRCDRFGLDLDVGEIAERLVGRHLQVAVLVDALLALLDLLGRRGTRRRAQRARCQVDAELL